MLWSNRDFLAYKGTIAEEYHNFSYLISYGLDEKNSKFSYGFNGSRNIKPTLMNTIKERNSRYVQDIVESNDLTLIIDLVAKSPYISGLGEPHVTETGLKIHTTYGVPYLEASSIKGMFRAWCGEAGIDKQEIEKLFGDGTDDSDEVNENGALVFHDTFFEDLAIQMDIMTPHKEERALSTTPIQFLNVDFKDTARLIISVRPNRVQAVKNLPQIGQWLITALEEYGLGAKTALGYGRFTGKINTSMVEEIAEKAKREKEEALKEQQEQAKIEAEKQRIENMSDEERQIFESLSLIEQAETDQAVRDNVVKQEAFIDENAENKEVIIALYDFYERFDLLKKPSKKMKPRVQKLKKIYQQFSEG